jgi:hypothetical protein
MGISSIQLTVRSSAESESTRKRGVYSALAEAVKAPEAARVQRLRDESGQCSAVVGLIRYGGQLVALVRDSSSIEPAKRATDAVTSRMARMSPPGFEDARAADTIASPFCATCRRRDVRGRWTCCSAARRFCSGRRTC